MASIKSTILVVTGSFCNPKFYDSTVNILPKDVQIEIPHLPTVGLGKDTGRPGPVPTMNDDAEFLLGRIKRLVVDEDKDVVVVAHSYGGVPSTEAIGMAKEQGLLKEDRKAKGEKGGVVRLAYMTVLVPELGGNAADMLGEIEEQYRMDFGVDESGWMYHKNLKRTGQICAQNLSEADRQYWFEEVFPRHSAVSFANELTREGWKHLPLSYLVAEEDHCIPPEVQRAEIERFEKATGKKVDVTSVRVDHVLNVSAPEVMRDWLVSLSEKE